MTLDTEKRKHGTKRRIVKKKWIIPVAVVAAAGIFAGAKLLGGGADTNAQVLDLTDTSLLYYTDLEKSISSTGVVESNKSTTVYSTMGYTVKSVDVKVGDKVKEGQLLAQLDDTNILEQITTQELSMEAAQLSSSQQIKSAQTNYENYKSSLESGLNSSVNSAQSAVDNAYQAYEKAVETYQRYSDGLAKDQNSTLIGAQSALQNAQSALSSAASTLNDLQSQYNSALQSRDEAKAELDTANANMDKVKSLEDQLAALIPPSKDEAALASEIAQKELRKTEIDTLLLTATDADKPALEAEKAQIELDIAALNAELTTAQEYTLKKAQLEIELEAARALVSDTDIERLEFAASLSESQVTQLSSQLTSAQSAYGSAQRAYDTQVSSYAASSTTVDQTLADYYKNIQTTYDAYQKALTSLSAAEKSAYDQLETYKNNISSAKAGANTSVSEENLRQLKVDLESTSITAPCEGTITAVYAKVGASGSGLLFVIEDVDDLMVETSIKGYDVGKVQEGTKVKISSEATDDEVYDGMLSLIAPTANKNAQGMTDKSGEAIFAAEVDVTSASTRLRIGMEAELDFILEAKKNVLAVPYDAVYKNENGDTCVIEVKEQDDGSYILNEIPVSVGMDDDLDIEIFGDGVYEGMRIVTDPDSYIDFIGMKLKSGKHASALPFAAGAIQ